MFVWITPNSIKSNWIYFESGYVYSRKIKVIPIGFDGIRLEHLPAPLNILQGFNINSSSSLNNIIATINSEFTLTFPNIFTDNFYENEILKNAYENSSELVEYISGIESKFHSEITHNQKTITILNDDWSDSIKKILEENKEKFTIDERNRIYGVGYKIYSINDNKKAIPEIYIDPLAFNNFWRVLREFHKQAYDSKKFSNVILKIMLNKSYALPEDHFVISPRLLNTEVIFDTEQPHVLYQFRNIQFRINIYEQDVRGGKILKKELVILVNHDSEETVPLLALVKLLVKQKIIIRAE